MKIEMRGVFAPGGATPSHVRPEKMNARLKSAVVIWLRDLSCTDQ
jgi:hypothetical protein